MWIILVPDRAYGQGICATPWTIEETQRIGSIDGDDVLTWVYDLEVGPDGTIYVAQTFTPYVVVFSSDGRRQPSIGRGGSGPGELNITAFRLGWMHDMLWVSDMRATHFFGPDGTPIRQSSGARLLLDEGSRLVVGHPLADGTFLGHRRLTRNWGFYRSDELPLLRLSADGEIVDTVLVVGKRPSVTMGDIVVEHPLADWLGVSRLPVDVTPDGAAVVLASESRSKGEQSAFDVLKIGIRGDTLLEREVTYEPRPLPREERSWWAEVFGNQIAGDYTSGTGQLVESEATRERERREAREALELPDHYPPVRQVVAGHDGSIWVLREFRYDDQIDRWEVFGSDGELEGAVEVSHGRGRSFPGRPRQNVFRATRDELWTTTLGEFDVTYIHRYRVNRNCQS